MTNKYLWIGNNSDPIVQNEDQLRSLKDSKICRRCGFNFTDDSLDVWLGSDPTDEAYHWFVRSRFIIFNIEFLQMIFQNQIPAAIPFGKVMLKGGVQTQDYASLNIASRIFVRGSWAPRIGPICTGCGRHHAVTPQGGPLYVMETAVQNRNQLYLSQSGSPLVRDDLPYKAYKQRWRHLVLEDKVAVFKKSFDGLSDVDYSYLGHGKPAPKPEFILEYEEYQPPKIET